MRSSKCMCVPPVPISLMELVHYLLLIELSTCNLGPVEQGRSIALVSYNGTCSGLVSAPTPTTVTKSAVGVRLH